MTYQLISHVDGVTVKLTENPCNAEISLTENAKKELSRILLEDGFDDWSVPHIVNAISEEHCGDCTCVPASCSRCFAEGALGLNTFPFSKHVGHSLSSMAFQAFASEEDKAKQAAWVKEYAEKYPSKMTDEERAIWEPKWERTHEEALRAWDEHVLLYKKQQDS